MMMNLNELNLVINVLNIFALGYVSWRAVKNKRLFKQIKHAAQRSAYFEGYEAGWNHKSQGTGYAPEQWCPWGIQKEGK